MDEQHKPITYGDIKDFVNKMTDEQLKQDAKIWIADNESPTDIHAIEYLGEERYYFVDAEIACGMSDFADLKDNFTDDDGNELYQTLDDALKNEIYRITPADRVYFHGFDF